MMRKIPDLFYEQQRLGELPSGIEAADDPDALAALDASDADILKRYPARVMALSIRERAKARRGGMWVVTGPAIAFALMAMAVVGPLQGPPEVIGVDHGVEEGIRLKGMKPHLRVHHVLGGQAERLEPGAQVAAGDVLQLSYVATDAPYGVVLSIDGRGSVTVHHPLRAEVATQLSGDGATELGASYALDDAPAFERFFLVTGPDAFSVDEVRSAAERLAASGDARTGALSISSDLQQASFLIEKGASR